MKKIKAFLCGTSFLMAALPMLTACNKEETHAMWLRIWCDTKIQSLTMTQAKAWASQMAELYGADIGIKVDPVGEGTAASNMITDVETGADLYCFAQDQLNRLRSAGALKEIIDPTAKAKVKNENDEASVSAASIGDSLLAYPLTSDNSFMMYYDTSFFTNPSDLADLETIIEKCEAGGRKVYFDLNNAWYNASVFYAYGCKSEWMSNPDGTFYDVDDTYRSANGVKACKALYNVLHTHKQTIISDSTVSTAFQHKPGEAPEAAVCVSGTWDYADAVSYLGDNLGAVEIPHVTVDGERVQLKPFLGCKLIGVKPQEDAEKGAYAELLAEHLISKECQLERFEQNGWGPSNLEAQNSDAVKQNPALVALGKQREYSVIQGQYPLDWWTAAGGIATALADDDCGGTDAEINAILQKYKGAIAAMINGDAPQE